MAITINGTGTITGLTAGGLPDGSITTDDLAANAVTAAKLAAGAGGKILQVQTTGSITSTPSTTSQESFGDISGFSVNITPAATSSKVLVIVNLGRVGCNFAGGRITAFRLMRDSTAINVGTVSQDRFLTSFVHAQPDPYYTGGITYTFLDSPSTTSQVTYKLQFSGQNGEIHYINRGGADDNNSDAPNSRAASSMTVMEVGA